MHEVRGGSLNGKAALVTGGASGIGRAIARALAEAGSAVAVIDIDRAAGEATAREITAQRRRALFLCGDVSRSADCERVVAGTLDALGGLDILVNSAGVIERGTVLETDEQVWERVFAINLKSIYLLARQAIPRMVEAGGGVIINIGSGWGLSGGRRAAAYCAAKGGVVQLTRAMALDHGGANIRVNCICPGDTDTPLLRREAEQLGTPLDSFLEEAGRRPLPGLVQPEDVAAAALFLASDAAASITGTTLVVDRGGLAGTA